MFLERHEFTVKTGPLQWFIEQRKSSMLRVQHQSVT